MWELDYKESWALKNWWFWTVVLKKTLESPLDGQEIQPVQPKGDQSWMFIGRTNVEAHAKSWLIWKDPDAGKDWGQEEKGMTEDEMVGWHHRLDGHGFGWTPGVGDGQGVLACCSSWSHKESDTTEWLNWTELKVGHSFSFSECCVLSQFFHFPLSFSSSEISLMKILMSYNNFIFKCLLPSRFSRVRLCATPWTAAYQASPSMGFSRQEYCSGLPFPSPFKCLPFLNIQIDQLLRFLSI